MPVVTIGENTGDDYAGCEDCTIYDASNHDGSDLFLTTPDYNALIKFSGLSNIAATSTVNDATIYFYPSYSNSSSSTIRRLLLNWVESEATVNVWSTGNSWTTTGGESQGNDVSATSTGTFVPGATTGSYVSFGSAQFDADVEDFIDGTYPNYGWNIICDAGGWIANESANSDGTRPYLEVDYTAGAAGLNITIAAHHYKLLRR